ncbi:hypothetical protein GCM10008094_30130 [Aidingimonas halophila]|nr:hypothetical protein GCM10008094_30130 [Aidingimonas halophila]
MSLTGDMDDTNLIRAASVTGPGDSLECHFALTTTAGNGRSDIACQGMETSPGTISRR